MASIKQIFRGILTSICILFCYTIGLTLYFTYPNQFVLYAIFAIVSVLFSICIMFSNNRYINHWIWLGILIGLPLGYYMFEVLYQLFPTLYEYLHPYLYYGTMVQDGTALLIFVAQYFITFMILLPIAYDLLQTYRKSRYWLS